MIKVGADRFMHALRHPIPLAGVCHELDGRHLLAGCSRPFRPPTLLSRTGRAPMQTQEVVPSAPAKIIK